MGQSEDRTAEASHPQIGPSLRAMTAGTPPENWVSSTGSPSTIAVRQSEECPAQLSLRQHEIQHRIASAGSLQTSAAAQPVS